MPEEIRWGSSKNYSVFELMDRSLDDLRQRFERGSESGYSVAPGSSERMRLILNAVCDRLTPLPHIAPDGEDGLVASWRGDEELLQIVVDDTSAADIIYVRNRTVEQFDVDLAVPAGVGELRRRLFNLIDSIEGQASARAQRSV